MSVELRGDGKPIARTGAHHLRITDERTEEERERGIPSYGPNFGVYLDGMRLAWQEVEIVLDHDNFAAVKLTLAIGAVDVSAIPMLKVLLAQAEEGA